DAQQARAEADAARNQAEANRIARQRAESEAAEAPSNGPVPSTVPATAPAPSPANSQDLPIAPPPPPAPAPRYYPPPQASNRSSNNSQQQEARMRLLQRLNGVASTRDTPRGLVVTLPDSSFDTAFVRSTTADTLSRLASVLTQPGLRVTVEGFSDGPLGANLSQQRADAVRDSLVRRGLNPGMVTTRNIADGRPLTSNATPSGRVQNRRVEIIVAGDMIGSLPLWDRSYDVTLR
ncbi:MAG TPA: OmpA family protein, partial [Bryobacteraceae bacterium]